MDNKTKEAFKQLQSELRSLQSNVETLRLAQSSQQATASKGKGQKPADSDSIESGVPDGGEDDSANDGSTAVSYMVRIQDPFGAGMLKMSPRSPFGKGLGGLSDDRVAAIGNALSAAPKVSVLRALFASKHQGESAAALAEITSLTSGSLYYHLRDLTHAGLIEQVSRGQFALTPKGICALLLVSSLALEDPVATAA